MKTAIAALVLALVSLASAARAAGPPAAPVWKPTSFPGFQARHVADPVVVFDPVVRRWRMYYSAAATEQFNESAWDVWTVGLVTSADTRVWQPPDVYEPVLFGRKLREGEVVDAEPIRAAFDSIEVRPASVLRDGRGWRMYYTGWNGAERSLGGGRVEKVGHAIGLATSRDGVSWEKTAGGGKGGAVLAPGEGAGAVSTAHPSVLKDGARYRMWYEAHDGRTWRLAHATSDDGARWTTTGTVVEPGGPGSLDELGVRRPVVIRTPLGFELYYQGWSRRAAPSSHVLRAVSADGLTWRKRDRELSLGLDPARRGEEQIHVGSVVVRPGGRRQVFFSRQTTVEKAGQWGTVVTRPFSIWTQTVGASE